MISNQYVSHDTRTGKTTISGDCIITKKRYTVVVPTRGYWEWQQGTLIQKAMPTVSADDREFLISGTSPEGWKEMNLGDEDDDEDEEEDDGDNEEPDVPDRLRDALNPDRGIARDELHQL